LDSFETLDDPASAPERQPQIPLARSKAASVGLIARVLTVISAGAAAFAMRESAPMPVPLFFGLSAVAGLCCVLSVRSFLADLREQEPLADEAAVTPGALAESPLLELLRSGRRRYLALFLANLMLGDIALAIWVVLRTGIFLG